MLALVRGGANLIGISEDPTMWGVESLALKAAACRANVLLEGESGVGKAYIARRIHQASAMAGKGFFTLFCLPGGERLVEPLSMCEHLRQLERYYGTIHVRGIDLLDGLGQRELLGLLDERERQTEAADQSTAV
jgi:transcriptional regulator of aromatic amino acid metabolism